MSGYTLRLLLHALALLGEAVGTLFVWLDSYRIGELANEIGHADAGYEPERLRPWYYHSAALGFGLLFAGIVLAAAVLWIEHLLHGRSHRRLRTPPPHAPF